eukprot:TRINITY_DN14863_c0_g1_i1.p1 TRINITY_DN14863_c0_g1~~TRINITY_DN14863_c0_g1_i1.p1  ORF type:complete len:304 (+),score=77.29 TRINITY_DN14863_c0_g1_i1:59-970(+)
MNTPRKLREVLSASQQVDVIVDERSPHLDPTVKRQLKAGLIRAEDIVPPAADEDIDVGPSQVVRRKVKKMVEVPVTRKVKVPVTNTQVVETTEKQIIKVKKQILEDSFEWVDETYTEIEEQPAVRMKEVWVKKLVPEQYMKKVEVRKTRRVKVPCVVKKEIEEEVEVTVPTSKIVEVPGYRVDEVVETKLVEVEGWQEIEMVPKAKPFVQIDRTRDVPTTPDQRRKIERKVGVRKFDTEDERLQEIDTDSDDDDGNPDMVKSQGDVRIAGNERRTKLKGYVSQQHEMKKSAVLQRAAGNVPTN